MWKGGQYLSFYQVFISLGGHKRSLEEVKLRGQKRSKSGQATQDEKFTQGCNFRHICSFDTHKCCRLSYFDLRGI